MTEKQQMQEDDKILLVRLDERVNTLCQRQKRMEGVVIFELIILLIAIILNLAA